MCGVSKLKQISRAVREKLYKEFLCITLAYFMEEGCFALTDSEGRPLKYYDLKEKREKWTFDADKIENAYNKMQEWLAALYGSKRMEDSVDGLVAQAKYDSKIISINKIRDIIYERTGARAFY